MEKIILFNCEDACKIKQLASVLKIKTIICEDYCNESVITDIIKGTYEKGQSSIAESLILMCDLTDAHVDRMLLKIKEKGICVDYKAVLTKTNSKWTVGRLFAQMEFEKKQCNSSLQ